MNECCAGTVGSSSKKDTLLMFPEDLKYSEKGRPKRICNAVS